jgi:hypothetical protein
LPEKKFREAPSVPAWVVADQRQQVRSLNKRYRKRLRQPRTAPRCGPCRRREVRNRGPPA